MHSYSTRVGLRAVASLLVLCCFIISKYNVEASCYHPVYCRGPVLEAIQTAGLFNDSKTFVDMPMKVSPFDVIDAFNKLPPNPSNSTIADFVAKYFFPAGTDVVPVVPDDWNPNPELFEFISDPTVKEFANILNSKWLHLVREFNDSFCEGCVSHIPVPNPFVIAGSRFREYYYWDTYWAIDGLLLTDMSQTALGIIQNFLGLVRQFGFIPNGGRIYYLNRSQPPMLTQMVKLYFANVPDMKFLTEALPVLDAEYDYWMTNHSVKLGNGTLNRYYVNNSYPRPESYAEDVITASGLSAAAKLNLYMQLASGAETGWDFSTRWMAKDGDLSSLVTTSIIPVDLNCILYANEVALAELNDQAGNYNKGVQYRQAAAARLATIQQYLWNEKTLSWNDYNFVTKTQNTDFYGYQFVPFWAGVYEVLPHKTISTVIQTLLPQFSYVAGIPTSTQPSGQQWDFPNGWAPLQFFAVQGFFNVLTNPNWEDPYIRAQLTSVTKQLAHKWITTNYCGYKKYNLMFEKYDVTSVGSHGGGGEYTVQDGFGWTNGVALRFIAEYADTLVMGECPN